MVRFYNWASSPQNLSSGLPGNRDPNQSPQLQRLARASSDIVLSKRTNNKIADQSARVRRLVCAFVVRKPPKTGFLASRPICFLGCFVAVATFTFLWYRTLYVPQLQKGSYMIAHVLLNY